MHALPLELTAHEVLTLTDRVQNTDKDDGRAMAKPFLIKLATAYLEMVTPSGAKSGTVTIYITEHEAWLARSKFNSGDRCDADPKLGIHLLRKLYAILLDFATADVVDALPDADASKDRAWTADVARDLKHADDDYRGEDGLAWTR